MTSQALVVEDEVALCVLYESILSSVGYEVLVANNGEEAIAILDNTVPHLILLDMRLPMVNGVQVVDYLVGDNRFEETHVVIVSSTEDNAAQVDRLPSAEFILKPVRPATIRDIAEKYK